MQSTGPAEQRVEELIAHSIDAPVLAGVVELQAAQDAADILERLDEDAVGVLKVMNDRAAAHALVEMEHTATSILQDLVADGRADELASMAQLIALDDAVGLLRPLSDGERDEVLRSVPHQVALQLRDLIGYPLDTAAGIMTTRYVALPLDGSIGSATGIVRSHEVHEDLQYLPVTDHDGTLAGLVSLRDLLVHADDTPLKDVMGRRVKAVRADVDDEAVVREFQRHDYTMMPVVDLDDRLLRVVTVDDVLDLIQSEQTEDGSVRWEPEQASPSIPACARKRGRLPWFSFISTLLMLPASLVVLQFDGPIEQVAFLAVLMPMVAALAGNAGHQSLAVTLRGLAVDEVHHERVGGLLLRELITGFLSGLLLGLLLLLVVLAKPIWPQRHGDRRGAVGRPHTFDGHRIADGHGCAAAAEADGCRSRPGFMHRADHDHGRARIRFPAGLRLAGFHRVQSVTAAPTRRTLTCMQQDLERILIDRDAIAERIGELGRMIVDDLGPACESDGIVLVPIMTGSITFIADLMRQLPLRVRIGLITASSYEGTATTSSGEVVLSDACLPESLAGRHVLIVDDILDSGRTIRRVRAEIESLNRAVCVSASCSGRRFHPQWKRPANTSDSTSRTSSSWVTDSTSTTTTGICRTSACCVRTWCRPGSQTPTDQAGL